MHKQPRNKEKLYKIWKIFTKVCAKRGHDSSPHLNLIVSTLGAEEPQPRTKTQKYKTKKTKQDTTIYELTHKSKTQPHPIN